MAQQQFAGDAGVIVFKQDATGGWNVTSSHVELSGFLSNLSNITINQAGVGTVSWYYDGTDYLLYTSDIT